MTRYGRIVILFFVSVVSLWAQATEGSILGTVTDPASAPIPSAIVTLRGENTGLVRSTRTNEVGEYVIAALPLGSYAVSVEQPGFKKAVFPGLAITVKARL